MNLLLVFIGILLVSFWLAQRSMKDFDTSKEIKKMIKRRKTRGTILFLKQNKIKHYSSSLSSSLTSKE